MTHVARQDGFARSRAAIPTCSLDPGGAQAQKARYRAIAPFISNVHEDPISVVIQFEDNLDVGALDETIAVERQCCGAVLSFELDRPNRSLRVTAADPADSRALAPIAAGFREARTMSSHDARRIGPIGTVARVLLGLALLTLAYLNKPAGLLGGLQLHDLLLGLVGLPAASVAVGLLARRYHSRPLRFSGAGGTAVNLGALVVLFANHYTAGAAALFYGATLLLAAWRGQAGCEFTLLSNVLLGRDDEIGCPAFTPIDALEARQRSQRTR
jgi:hypothetical protein